MHMQPIVKLHVDDMAIGKDDYGRAQFSDRNGEDLTKRIAFGRFKRLAELFRPLNARFPRRISETQDMTFGPGRFPIYFAGPHLSIETEPSGSEFVDAHPIGHSAH